VRRAASSSARPPTDRQALALEQRPPESFSADSEDSWSDALTELVPDLPDDLLARVLHMAERISKMPQKIRLVATLGRRMPADPLQDLLEPYLSYQPGSQSLAEQLVNEVFVPSIELASAADAARIWDRVMEITQSINECNRRGRVLRAIAPLAEKPFAAASRATLYRLWSETLHLAMNKNRKYLLGAVQFLAKLIAVLGGPKAAADTYRAIDQVGQRWP
jgi:hypothetical protein